LSTFMLQCPGLTRQNTWEAVLKQGTNSWFTYTKIPCDIGWGGSWRRTYLPEYDALKQS
jgi:hypothetical protein